MILPDYRKPFQEVFAETVTLMLQESGDLDILGQVDHEGEPPIGLPSWVPDWRRGIRDVFHIQAGYPYTASASSRTDIKLLSDKHRLALRGITLDTIISRQEKPLAVGEWGWVQELRGISGEKIYLY